MARIRPGVRTGGEDPVKVYVFPADQFACGRYRLEWPARALAQQGHDVVVVHPKDASAQIKATMKGNHMVALQMPPDCDVAVVQRVTNPYLTQAIPLMRAQGIAVVVDVDDDLTCIDPRNPAWKMLHPGNQTGQSWEHCLTACQEATYVTVSAPALLDVYARHGRGAVLYNRVPQRFLDISHRDSAVVGWAGSVHSHPTDLQAMGNALSRFMAGGGEFRIVGPRNFLDQAVGASLAEKIACSGNVPFDRWAMYVNTLGIGVVPLADSRFNKSKSHLKGLEYAALGIPSIFSPRPEYARLHREHGIGNLAEGPRDWLKIMKDLAASPARRVEESLRDRATVAAHLVLEANAWRWMEIWETAFKLQRSATPRRVAQTAGLSPLGLAAGPAPTAA